MLHGLVLAGLRKEVGKIWINPWIDSGSTLPELKVWVLAVKQKEHVIPVAV